MKHIYLKCISALTASALTASALSGSLRIMDFNRKVHAAEAALPLGDVDKDGQINATDAQLALVAAAEIIAGNEPDLDDDQLVAADVDYNKDVTPIDAQYILMYFLQESVLEDPITWYELTGVKPPVDQPALQEFGSVTTEEILETINGLDYSVATTNQPVETSLTGEMKKTFQNMTAPEAYEYIYNNVNTEFYFGSRKGAIGTFEQAGGNDIDQASLMIAVLRDMGYEADYYTALVELTADQMMEITATDDAEIAYKIFREQASAQVKTVDALRDGSGKLTGMDIEHTWVTAKLPSKYVNGDESDELVEIQIDTSFKEGYRGKLSDQFASLSEENVELLTQAVTTQDGELLNSITDKLESDFDASAMDETQYARPVKSFRTVPAAENMVVSEQQLIGSDYLKGRTDQIQINLGGRNAALINAPEAYGKQLVIEYGFDDDYELFEEFLLDVPATIFDITNYYTQMGIKVQPKVMLDGRQIGAGTSVAIGTEQKMTITVYTGGAVQELHPTNMLSGSMYAITLDMQNISDDEIFRRMQNYPSDSSGKSFRKTYNAKEMGSLLALVGTQYMAEADMIKTTYADQSDVHAERFMSVCVSAFNLEITRNMVGEIKVEEQGTMGLDVKSDSYTAVSLEGNAEDREHFYFCVGVHGSTLEGTVLKTFTGTDSVSTMRILQEAAEQGIEIVTISKDDPEYTALLDTLKANGISDFAMNEITTSVEEGSEVTVPVKNIRLGQWNGIGYIISNENGYSFMLSNGTNGGETVDPLKDPLGYFDQAGGEDGQKLFGFIYNVAFLAALWTAISAGIALCALCPMLTFTWAIIWATIAFIIACVTLYEAGMDMVEFYSGEKTPEDKFGALATGGKDLLVWFIEWAIK